jgi:hypothetical protein
MNKTQNGNKTGNTHLLPFPVIVAATSGDVDAINQVLKHYEGYIIALSTRRLYDDYGNVHLFVDEELRRTLETKLITKILTFDVA